MKRIPLQLLFLTTPSRPLLKRGASLGMATAILSSLSWMSGGAHAQNVYEQVAGASHIGMEAENYDSISYQNPTGNRLTESGFIPISKSDTLTTPAGTVVLNSGSNASGNEAILASPLGPDSSKSVATFKMKFSEPGIYRLFFRASLFENAPFFNGYNRENELFIATEFNTIPPENGAQVVQFASFADDGHVEGQYRWRNTTFNFTVSAAQVGTVFSYSIRDRSAGLSIDRVIFRLRQAGQPTLNPATNDADNALLDGLANSPLAGSVTAIPELDIQMAGARPEIRWPQAGNADWVLRKSTTLQGWQAVSGSISTSGGFFVYAVPSAEFSANPSLFFRLELP